MASWKFVIRSENKRKDDRYKLVLRVTHDRKSKYFNIIKDHQNIYLSQKEYSSIGTSTKKRLRDINDFFIKEGDRINEILGSIQGGFSFKVFATLYEKGDLLSDCFDHKIAELDASNKFSSAEGYRYAKKSFVSYKDLPVGSVGLDYIKEYVEANGVRKTYLKYLRHVLKSNGNDVFKDYSIKGDYKIKHPLIQNELKLLRGYRSEYKGLQRSVDFWMMSFMGGGMNTKDWYYLKWSMIHGEMEYITKYRSKSDQPIIIHVTKTLRRLINKYADLSSEYVFGLVDDSKPEKDQYKKYKTFLGNMRRDLKKVQKQLGIKTHLTPYVARHTHANFLYNKGVPLDQIGESMAQKDRRSTERYIHTMYQDARRKVAELLDEEE